MAALSVMLVLISGSVVVTVLDTHHSGAAAMPTFLPRGASASRMTDAPKPIVSVRGSRSPSAARTARRRARSTASRST